jgi:hypothetical protein
MCIIFISWQTSSVGVWTCFVKSFPFPFPRGSAVRLAIRRFLSGVMFGRHQRPQPLSSRGPSESNRAHPSTLHAALHGTVLYHAPHFTLTSSCHLSKLAIYLTMLNPRPTTFCRSRICAIQAMLCSKIQPLDSQVLYKSPQCHRHSRSAPPPSS